VPRALHVVLERQPPPGFVTVRSGYPLDVIWRGRPLARAERSPRVSLPPGRHVLQLLAPEVFLRSEVAADVSPGGELALAAPALGQLNVRANPDNCQVFIDGRFVDYPPILGRPVAAGRHAVSFRWPDGTRDDQLVETGADSPSFAFGRKAKE
jgi:hypothetical protein